MDDSKIIYSDNFYKVIKCSEYPLVPGFYVILENDKKWYSSSESIERLAILEKTIRDVLINNGIELVGIYREENDNQFKVLLIPYYVSKLKECNISPDLYQPFIVDYLNSFDDSYFESVNQIDERTRRALRKVVKK